LVVQQRQELDQTSPVLSWAHKALSSKCFTKQYDFQVKAASLTQIGLDYQKEAARNPGAGLGEIKPFERVLKDGFLRIECVKDALFYHGDKFYDNRHDYKMHSANVSVVHYSAIVTKMDQKSMTPDVCFDFCRTVPDMNFFGILNGRDCYCEPYYKQMAGDTEACDSVCEGDATQMCGSKEKSQIFEMHMCADTVGDLNKGMSQLVAVSKALDEKATLLTGLATKGTKDTDSFKAILEKIGDFAASNLLRKAWNRAYDLKKLADQARKVKADLDAGEEKAKKLLAGAFLQQGRKGAPDFSKFDNAKKAEDLMDEMEKLRKEGKEMTEQLGAASELYDEVSTDMAKTAAVNRTDQFHQGFYFVSPEPYSKANWGKDKSTCGGDLVQEPVFGLTEDQCAYACDETKGCEAYQYFAKESSVCMLMSKATELTHYDMCNHALEGACDPSPKGQQKVVLAQTEEDDAAEVPFPWKTKSKDANATLFQDSVKGMCTTVYGCEGTNAPVVDCSLMDHYKCSRYTKSEVTESGGVLAMNFKAWLKSGKRASSCKVNPVPCLGCKKYSTCSGPYAETEEVEIKKGDVASYSWKSSGDVDNYEVFVGLYSKTCGLVDFQFQRGEEQKWRTFELFAPKKDKYYMKFLLASYDGSGGGAVGADMSIKDVKQTKAKVPRIFNTEARCMLRFADFQGQDLKPDPKGQCKNCFQKSTKRCLKPDETFPVPDDGEHKKMKVAGRKN
jgi:hypothetical protein